MCGIAGIFALDGRQIENWRLEAMNRCLTHRGPDDAGIWSNGVVGLAHRRLSIIDLETGHQPMLSRDRSLVVIANGEIYNFRELRRTLEGKGHRFRTSSDTEVLLHAYQEWGTEMLRHLNGMYAFVLYDDRKRCLLLARDRLGVKPLYYFANDRYLVFASELGSLVASGLVPTELDPKALELYLHYQYVPCPYSIYRDVCKLPPAQYAEWRRGERRPRQKIYWDVAADRPPDAGRTAEEWLSALGALLKDAVEIRLRSDVPFGAFLSGGVDSGLTVALMTEALSQPVRTFSIGWSEGDDELPRARTIADRFGTEHREYRVRPEGLTLIPKLCRHFGEPFADSSAVPTYYVSQLACQHVKMVLSGDGGDELFAGYRRYGHIPPDAGLGVTKGFLWRYARSACLKRGSLWRGNGGPVRDWSCLRFLANLPVLVSRLLGKAPGTDWFWGHDARVSQFTRKERRLLLGGGGDVSPAAYFARRYPFPAGDSPVAAAQYSDFKSYLPDDVLVKVDRMSMAQSLEVRSPLLDYRLAELAFSMPTRYKLCLNEFGEVEGKKILKRLAVRYLGQEHVSLPKRGFSVPYARWLREDEEGYLRDCLSNGSPVYDYVDSEFVSTLIEDHMKGARENGHKLWNLVCLDAWLRYVHAENPRKN